MSKIWQLQEKALKEEPLSFNNAVWLMKRGKDETFEMIAAANGIRHRFKGDKVGLCSIVNAKSGRCPENCSFCAQSAHHKCNIDTYKLMSSGEMLTKAEEACKNGTTCFSIVTSGKGITSEKELDEICSAITRTKNRLKMKRCASLGILSAKQMKKLKSAGLEKFHHNLETAESYFDKVCTTHSFRDRVNTVKAAKKAGLSVCCGGIFGLGESLEQRVEMAFQIKALDPDSVPINFLNPIPGTRAGKNPILSPLEALRIISVFRFIMPEKDIVICGGREVTLKSLQPLMFTAGANMTLMGNYLTTTGNSLQEDLKMIADLGLKVGS